MNLKRFALICSTFCVASAAFAQTQVLNNRRFNNGNFWVLTGNVSRTNYADQFWAPGNAPNNAEPGLQIVANGVQSTGTATQIVNLSDVGLTPGLYSIDANGWFNVYNTEGRANGSRARFRLIVDGVNSGHIDLLAPNATGWTGWTNLSLGPTVFQVNESVGLEIILRADGTGGEFNWGQIAADDMWLQLTPVPEPSTMILLAAGAAGLVHRRRRMA